MLPLADPDGLRLELVETDDTPLASWPDGPVGPETASTAFHGVTLLERDAERTIDFLTGPM
ncbi:MAG: ring-cleaving dioxygenase, partial [Actinobacteria bacterium]|nr:ring-cleaving dioxygenase [Actinomycetota bacterium]NIW28713.1 ring-cleaving dioxygenase [Actinomycetota bacterium]NIX20001.1 ring-cleaving dioxygenase [Actinomycetota bacterium]NIX50053.1 ring-cleaving dioxygenase [Actinomycetota bacterium]